MTQEENLLLLKDLSARLSYGVMCQVDDGAAGLNDGKLVEIDITKELVRFDADYYWDAYIDNVKPYLRPMSSMTEEEKSVLALCDAFTEFRSMELKIDFLNKNHFDYRGLIQKGLAIEVTEENNPYKEQNYDARGKTKIIRFSSMAYNYD